LIGAPPRARLITAIGVLGFASGLPNVLVNDTLSAWLSDLGFKPSDIGLLALQPRHAVLHRAARHLQPGRQRGHGGAAVGPQQRDQFAVGVVDGCHVGQRA
jgi:hypothetical protein